MGEYFHLWTSFGCSINVNCTHTKELLFCFEFELVNVFSIFTNKERGRKAAWWLKYLILFPHTPALFMRSQTETARHKIAVLSLLRCVSSLIPFLSTRPVTLFRFSYSPLSIGTANSSSMLTDNDRNADTPATFWASTLHFRDLRIVQDPIMTSTSGSSQRGV